MVWNHQSAIVKNSYYNPKTFIAISLLDHVRHATWPRPRPGNTKTGQLQTQKHSCRRIIGSEGIQTWDINGFFGIWMGCEWDMNGIWMGCEWYTNGIRMGYEWDFNGISMVVKHQSMDWWTKHTKLLGLCFKHGGVPHARCWFIFRGVNPTNQ